MIMLIFCIVNFLLLSALAWYATRLDAEAKKHGVAIDELRQQLAAAAQIAELKKAKCPAKKKPEVKKTAKKK